MTYSIYHSSSLISMIGQLLLMTSKALLFFFLSSKILLNTSHSSSKDWLKLRDLICLLLGIAGIWVSEGTWRFGPAAVAHLWRNRGEGKGDVFGDIVGEGAGDGSTDPWAVFKLMEDNLKCIGSLWSDDPHDLSTKTLMRNSPSSPLLKVDGMTQYFPTGSSNLLLTSLRL